jgi:hypothetical protein
MDWTTRQFLPLPYLRFAGARSTIAQVTTQHHHALDGYAWLRLPSARSSAEDEEFANEAAGWDR